MLKGTIDITHLKRELKTLPNKMKTAHRDTLNQMADSYLNGVRENAPLETGAYANSWVKKSVNHKRARITTPMGFLFELLEFRGSRPHEIRARIAPALHWIDPNTGAHRFALRVWHPGFKPKPHMRPLMDDLMGQAIRVLNHHYVRMRVFSKKRGKYSRVKITFRKLNVRKPKPKFPNRR